jgi:hypothetical protein
VHGSAAIEVVARKQVTPVERGTVRNESVDFAGTVASNDHPMRASSRRVTANYNDVVDQRGPLALDT